MNYYAGIGSRETPADVQAIMTQIAVRLKNAGWTLRSGGADGADDAFEKGAGDRAEIFLPWDGFNGRRLKSNSKYIVPALAPALVLVNKFHPAPGRLSEPATRLMARNGNQVLGADLNTPVKVVVCWTPEGSGKGGTGQAIRIAKSLNIPVVDLGSEDGMRRAHAAFLKQ